MKAKASFFRGKNLSVARTHLVIRGKKKKMVSKFKFKIAPTNTSELVVCVCVRECYRGCMREL
jgi:hypothetical protein